MPSTPQSTQHGAQSAPHRALSTIALLGGMLRRGMLLGLGGGVTLGAIYGTMICLPAAISSSTVAILLVGLILGAASGAIVGLGVGLVNGLVIGPLTCLWFYPLTNAVHYRWVVSITSFVLSLVGAGIGFTMTQEQSFQRICVPSFIAAGYSIWASQRGVTWYERAIAGRM
jgi:hypothetical protein